MSSECKCHTKDWCFFCEVYTPLEEIVGRLRGDIEAAEIAIKAYREQEIQLKATADLAVKALEEVKSDAEQASFITSKRGIDNFRDFIADKTKVTLDEIKRISTEGVTPDTKTCKECEAHQQEIEKLNVLIEQKDKEYAELEEQADRWREESGN